MFHPTKESITLKGLVVPSQWDNKGNITGIALSCFDEKEYDVKMDEMGGELIGYLHKRVEVVGQYTRGHRTKTIKVEEFNVSDWIDLNS